MFSCLSRSALSCVTSKGQRMTSRGQPRGHHVSGRAESESISERDQSSSHQRDFPICIDSAREVSADGLRCSCLHRCNNQQLYYRFYRYCQVLVVIWYCLVFLLVFSVFRLQREGRRLLLLYGHAQESSIAILIGFCNHYQ